MKLFCRMESIELTRGVPEVQLARFSAFVAARMGLRFPEERRRDLERGINAAARELGIADLESFIELLVSSSSTRDQIEVLASHLTIGETYFFRDKRLFKTLEESTLPELIQLRRNSGKHLRIWSAGCSSGEEPYSIAILLSKMIPDIGDWNITILATDINTRFLQKAVIGVYGNWSFRSIQPGIKGGFFNQREDGRFEVLSRIREMVTFSYLNLVEEPYPAIVNNTNAFDIIFCRNVLMYFVPELAGKVVRNLHRSLVDGGLLIVSPGELSIPVFPQFTAISAPGATLFKKENPRRASALPGRPLKKPKSAPGPAFTHVPPADRVPRATDFEIAPPPGAHNAQVESQTSKVDDQDPKDLYGEASALCEEGRFPEAVEKTEKLLLQNPLDAKYLALLARIYANWGKLDKALEWCEKALTAEKLHAGHHYLMSSILQELGRTEDAVVSLKRTLYLDPKFIPAYVALGNISRKAGKTKESVKHFENALLLLNSKRSQDVSSESEGINAKRLTEMIKTMQQAEIGR